MNRRSMNQESTDSNEIRRPIPTSLPLMEEDDGVPETQESLKSRILKIQQNKSLTLREKAVSVQKLMTRKWEISQTKTTVEIEEGEIERERQNPTYHDENSKILGCSHYQRACKLYTSCCGKWYTCRFCHDDTEDHTYDRYKTEKISCMRCHTVQNISSSCINKECNQSFAKYYCGTCKFHDNDENKDIYHCDKCNICRIGKGLGIDYFHCDKCNACMSISLQEHKCVERSLESNCPICSSYMFTSTTPVMFLPCGHCMHVACYEEYTLTNYICPLCSKSLGDMQPYFSRIDELLERSQMPPEYENCRSHIVCCDCERKSTTKYHFVYHKCQFDDCNSYNTRVLQQFKVDDEEEKTEAMDISDSDSLNSRIMDIGIVE